MTIDIESDHIVIAVGSKGRSEVEKSLLPKKAGVGSAAADVEMPRPEEREENGWKKVGGAEKRGPGRLTRAATAQKKIIDFDFGHFTEASKKRRAETALNDADKQPDMADQIAQLKDLVLKLLQQQQDMMQEQQSSAQELQSMRQEQQSMRQEQQSSTQKLQSMMQKQEEDHMEIQQLRKLLQDNNSVCRPSYSRALMGTISGSQPMQQATDTQTRATTPPQPPKPRPLSEDKSMVVINTLQARAQEKQDYTKMKEALEHKLDDFQGTRGCQIKCLRPLAGDRVGVVFKTEEDAERARKYTRWYQTAIPGARIQSEQWHPVKFDGVAKQAVLDSEINDDKTLNKDICSTFQAQNNTPDMDCTAHMARWISKPNALKKTGSLVLWLKHQLSAEKLIQMGTALFGATDAYCSKWERPSTADGPCYKCNKYGHKQYNCTRTVCCGLCSGRHNTRECTNQDKPHCSACSGNHTVFDRRCTLHPRHIKPYSIQQQRTPTQQDNPSLARHPGPHPRHPSPPPLGRSRPLPVSLDTAMRDTATSNTTVSDTTMSDSTPTQC